MMIEQTKTYVEEHYTIANGYEHDAKVFQILQTIQINAQMTLFEWPCFKLVLLKRTYMIKVKINKWRAWCITCGPATIYL